MSSSVLYPESILKIVFYSPFCEICQIYHWEQAQLLLKAQKQTLALWKITKLLIFVQFSGLLILRLSIGAETSVHMHQKLG